MPTTTRKPAATKTTTKPAATKPARKAKTVDELLAELTAAEHAVTAAKLDERRDAADPLIAKRNEAILAAVAAGATYSAIAKSRGVPTSTNRGLIRVLQGGKRL